MKHCISQQRPQCKTQRRGPGRFRSGQNSGDHRGDPAPRAGDRFRTLQLQRPRHNTGQLPPPTEAQEGDAGRACGPQKGWRRPLGSDVVEVVVQRLRGQVRAARAEPELSARRCSLRSCWSSTHPRQTGTGPTSPLPSHAHNTTSAQAGPRRLEGPALLNHPQPLRALRRPQDSQISEVAGTGPWAGQPANLGHPVPSEPGQGRSRFWAPLSRKRYRDRHRLETCRTEHRRTDTCRHDRVGGVGG